MPRVRAIISVQDGVELPECEQSSGIDGMDRQRLEGKDIKRRLKVIENAIASLVRHILACELPSCRCRVEVSLLICNDKRITELNAAYFGRNRPTDVLSFPQLSRDELEQLKHPHKCDSEAVKLLGDIVISIGAVRRQARRYKHSQVDELMRLVAHGFLHLLGYEDAEDAERKAMAKRERALIRSWKLSVWKSQSDSP
ncbi:MAG: hypothetical protein GDYSWBUE_000981 [Candidatus Fervidibacterota bacterium]